MYGYMGKLLLINLRNETFQDYFPDKAVFRKYIGGRGLGAKLLSDLLPDGADALGEENIFLVLTGPVTGTMVPVSGKYVVVTKSPASGGFVDAYSSGRIAVEIKGAGYDGLILTGKAKKPVYLYINENGAELRDAANLWGKDVFQAEDMLREMLNSPNPGLLCIGPAGENLVKFASVTSDYYRHAARGGVGTVLGAKKVKAIAVEGNTDVECYDPAGLMKLVKEHIQAVRDNPAAQIRMKYGTLLTLDLTSATGMLPTRNFQSGYFPEAKGNLGSKAVAGNTVASRGCFGCYLSCSKLTSSDPHNRDAIVIEGPEYETLGLMGANLGISDLSFVIKANEICDRLGMDTISAGCAIGFAMECSEKGLLDGKFAEEAAEIDLKFGSAGAALQLLERIAFRGGLGELLADGVQQAAKTVGKGSHQFAMEVKNLEFPAYEPRVGYGTALSYAVSPRGACHRRAWPPSVEVLGKEDPYATANKAAHVKKLSDLNCIYHSLIVCDFPAKSLPLGLHDFAQYLNLLTGWDVTEPELEKTADRIETQIRIFNNSQGFSRKDDRLPWRITNEPVPDGPTKGKYIPEDDLETMKSDYYALRGWDSQGRPRTETLQELEIDTGGDHYAIKSK